MVQDSPVAVQVASAWSFALTGVGTGFGAWAFTVVAEWVAIGNWYSGLPERPDFQGNGMNWLLLGLMFITPIEAGVINLLVFVIGLPVLFKLRRDWGLGPSWSWPVLLFVATLVVLVNLIMIGWGGTHEILILVTIPMLMGTLGGTAYMLRAINRELGKVRL